MKPKSYIIENTELMSEWDYVKNIVLDPTKTGKTSNKKIWWKCHKCGYTWQAQINNRSKGAGCPCCGKRVCVPGKNDLATIFLKIHRRIRCPKVKPPSHDTEPQMPCANVARAHCGDRFAVFCKKCGHISGTLYKYIPCGHSTHTLTQTDAPTYIIHIPYNNTIPLPSTTTTVFLLNI